MVRYLWAWGGAVVSMSVRPRHRRPRPSQPHRFILLLTCIAFSEPIVITGESVSSLIGSPVENIRMVNGHGNPVPFQVDEITPEGEYVCHLGEAPNSKDANGTLDSIDEIVFLKKDCTPPGKSAIPEILRGGTGIVEQIEIGGGEDKRVLFCSSDSTIPLSSQSYINYDHAKRKITTPWYYAVFGKKRFHFVRAGIKSSERSGYIDFTRELRLRIFLTVLWGLLPIQYNEENLVCLVSRYKVGPVRLVRRGDLYLKLGFFLKANSAAVNQICYPQMVRVPVYVHLPVQFKSFLKEAYIEMTPVITSQGKGYDFSVPHQGISIPLGESEKLDTIIRFNPNNSYFSVNNGFEGYGWVLNSDMKNRFLDGSGYIIQRPSERNGIAHCGYRLNVHDMPRGYYLITNWVLFSNHGIDGFESLRNSLENLSPVSTKSSKTFNAIKAVHTTHK
ncbi:MAG: hypothetical protein GF350_06695 [Chitinivibrionales bacterium]|nr:hypothetical protein [Chitinivibrionales bacterium]